MTKIKYLYFKDKPSLFSALEIFNEDAALLQHGWDTQPDAGASSLKAFDTFGASQASQQQKLLDNLYSVLDNTFQRVYLQKTPVSTSSHVQVNSDPVRSFLRHSFVLTLNQTFWVNVQITRTQYANPDLLRSHPKLFAYALLLASSPMELSRELP